jgi:hypothetical protein
MLFKVRFIQMRERRTKLLAAADQETIINDQQ